MYISNMRAKLKVTIGTRVRYHPIRWQRIPDAEGASEKLLQDALRQQLGDSNEFHDTHWLKEGTVIELSTMKVLPFKSEGKWPGTYYCGVGVRFDGESATYYPPEFDLEVIGGPVSIAADSATNQVPGRLKFPVYPGDIVRLQNDTRGSLFIVSDVVDSHSNDWCNCELAALSGVDSDAGKVDLISLLPEYSVLAFMPYERAPSYLLEVVTRGNPYRLYNDVTNLKFSSVDAELAFWSLDGASHRIAQGTQETLSAARARVVSGEADLLFVEESHLAGRKHYVLRKIHDCFEAHRSRIREVAMGRILTKKLTDGGFLVQTVVH